ncbi:hypothetical protein [Dorea sp.]
MGGNVTSRINRGTEVDTRGFQGGDDFVGESAIIGRIRRRSFLFGCKPEMCGTKLWHKINGSFLAML